jgi:vanillate O-demethylase ferredoxin subunit
MIAHVTQAALAQGLTHAQIHAEFFAPPPDDDGARGEHAFDVRLAASGRTIRVPAGISVVDSLAAHGVDLPVSCRQGVCGSCLTPVLAGEPLHRDHYLTDAERARNDCFLPCCSRARDPLLVLDL